jgi:N-acetyl sugar amidotransferase
VADKPCVALGQLPDIRVNRNEPAMAVRAYQICTRCVMDTSDPLIQFDEEGRCNLCTDFLENRVGIIKTSGKSDATLEELMDRVRRRGRGRPYDCVVGVSGGVDSSFTCALAAEHGLRVLAVHMDNGWDSVTSVANMRNLIRKLDLDYVTTVLPWKEFRQVQLAFLKASVPEAETPTDIAIQLAVHQHALKHGVRTILSGGNIATEGVLPVTWHYNARDIRYAHAILDQAKCPRKYFRTQRYGVREETYYKIIRDIKTLYPLNFMHYTRHGARELLERDYGWKYYGSKHGESGYTKFIQTFYMFVKHGIDYRRATFCSEILLGKISRDEALAVLDTPPFSDEALEQEIEYVCKKLAVPRAEMDAIIAAPPKYFYDYPNNRKKLGMLYGLYRALTGRTKASNF